MILYSGFSSSSSLDNFKCIGWRVQIDVLRGKIGHFVIFSNSDDFPDDSAPMTITFGTSYTIVSSTSPTRNGF